MHVIQVDFYINVLMIPDRLGTELHHFAVHASLDSQRLAIK